MGNQEKRRAGMKWWKRGISWERGKWVVSLKSSKVFNFRETFALLQGFLLGINVNWSKNSRKATSWAKL
jgi:hypothetical protein